MGGMMWAYLLARPEVTAGHITFISHDTISITDVSSSLQR